MASNAKVIEELTNEGYENVKEYAADPGIVYFSGRYNGRDYEFKSQVSEFHGDTEIHGRLEGSEDWLHMFDIEVEYIEDVECGEDEIDGKLHEFIVSEARCYN